MSNFESRSGRARRFRRGARSGSVAVLIGGLLTLLLIPAAASTSSASTAPAVPSALSYRLPVGPPSAVVRPFSAPTSRYAAGHLGVDLAADQGAAVSAAASGVVAYAGQVAGRGVVVIRHRDGIRTEYEPVRPSVSVGHAVVAGQQIGIVQGVHAGCPVQGCLHWGARRGEVYLNPLRLLMRLGPVRLLPGA
ncbi:peptidase M23-like protein [Jatrophihabitans sp. GAS493]|uniref:M23 family metallopeptidase n=1 Tax=Jatrophihabitans sp. GAS493 TaxID=1907575 RepID=UPI000BB7009D|nr:peptidoglycan DD-metalloendopeptidase family protein [Jatrophihabitans sp. GAS493]SOD74193.1 peptidase M23-like protein [Jatrophihabitans sp. GAS493]